MRSPFPRRRSDLARPTADDVREQLTIFSAIHAAMSRWPEVSALAAEAQETDDARQRLCSLLGVSELGSNAILEMQLRRVTVLEREQMGRRIRELESALEEMEDGG